jgi:O-antigen ligase
MAPVQAARQFVDPLRAALIRYPTLPLGAVALGVVLWWAADNGGFDGTSWYPGALFLLGLVVVGATVTAAPALAPPRLVVVAVVALVAYAAWSYLSIGWAHQKGDAWDGANRSLLYALVFALFAVWRPRARPATILMLAFALGVAVVGLVELLRAASAEDPRSFFIEGRFASPAGYMNANVALWSAALIPCVAFGARREIHPALRGLLVAAAVLLCGLAVIGQSRGWVFTAPLAVLAFIALTPKRVRTTLTLALVLGATAAVGGTLLDVYQSSGGRGFASAVSSAASAILVAALVAGIVAALVAVADRRAKPSAVTNRRAGWALGATAAVAAVIGLGAFVAANGSPFTALSDAWSEFKTQPSPTGGGSRLTGSLGSNRYDFWRVAWDRFKAAPVTGIGADNFQQSYLAERRSLDEPRYPHSVEVRALSQTGIIGAALLFTAMGAGLWAAVLAIRRRSGLGAVAAAAGTSVFVYWVLHGSVDWFWEFPVLGASAFALLGLAAGLMPRSPKPVRRDPRPVGRRLALPVAGAVATLLVAGSLVIPWMSLLEQHRAVTVWRTDPKAAFDRLDTAGSLNPLSATPQLLAGSIALRLDRNEEAMKYFRQALERDPRDAYAHLELGALLAQAGRRDEALRVLGEGAKLDPRDDIAAGVRRRVRRGQKVDIHRVNRELIARAEARAR